MTSNRELLHYVKSEAQINFGIYADRLRAVYDFREKNEAQTWARKWWVEMDSSFKNCLLYMVCGDQWARWEGALWASFPVNLQDDLMRLVRTLERSMRGAPWR